MNNIFAERLKKAMEQKNMKQIDLVKKAAEQGVKLGKSHVSQYLSGKTTPRSEILNFLATTLGVETEWLKGTDGYASFVLSIWKICVKLYIRYLFHLDKIAQKF